MSSVPGNSKKAKAPTEEQRVSPLSPTLAVAWTRVKSHKVAQWTLAYLALAYTLLHGAEMLGNALGWSHGLLRAFTLLLILGIPVVVTLAWYHGARGLQRVSGTELTIIAVLLALGGTYIWRDNRTAHAPASAATENTGPQEGVASRATPAPPAASIAVLAFSDLSAGHDQAYFSDGIAEEILNVLARVEGLKVASRTSSFQFRNSDLGTPAIAQKLGVRHILEGSVRKSGDTVRVTAQLIDASSDAHLWSQTFDRPLTAASLFSIQDEIAKAIVDKLAATLGAGAGIAGSTTVKADTADLDAYDLYLKGRSLFIARTPENLHEAAPILRAAVKKDPTFARGWELLAAVLGVSEFYGLREEPDYLKSSLEAVNTALRLDPKLSLAYAVRGAVHEFKIIRGGESGWDEVLADYSRAIVNDAQNATAYAWRGGTYETLGFLDRAVADQRRCLEIDPAYQLCRRFLAVAYANLGQTDAALREYERGLEEGYVLSDARFASIRAARGDAHGALAMLAQQYQETPKLIQPLFRALTDRAFSARDRADTLALADSMTLGSDSQMYALWMLKAYDRLVDIDIDTAEVFWVRDDSGWVGSEARKKMMRRWRLPEYWDEHGYPPQCRHVARSDFECP